MRSLYLRIWLTVLAALALFALVSGWLVQRHLAQERARLEAAAQDRIEAWAELMGLPEIGKTGAALSDTIEAELGEFLSRIEDRVRRDDDRLDEAIRRIVRQVSMEEIGKKPEVTVVVSRLQAE